jgi:hypothetical protein
MREQGSEDSKTVVSKNGERGGKRYGVSGDCRVSTAMLAVFVVVARESAIEDDHSGESE